MKALFYNKRGKLVWECKKDAQLELSNGSRAIRKGAVKGVLYDKEGNVIDRMEYKQN